MKKIIEKAIEGGWRQTSLCDYEAVCDPLFWKSLGKACGWEGQFSSGVSLINIDEWLYHAEMFHEINLTEGWDKAIKYLNGLIKKDL